MTVAEETCKEIMTMECMLVEKQACTTMTEPVNYYLHLTLLDYDGVYLSLG